MSRELTGSFESRHLGPRPYECDEMLKTIGVSSLDQKPGFKLDV